MPLRIYIQKIALKSALVVRNPLSFYAQEGYSLSGRKAKQRRKDVINAMFVDSTFLYSIIVKININTQNAPLMAVWALLDN